MELLKDIVSIVNLYQIRTVVYISSEVLAIMIDLSTPLF